MVSSFESANFGKGIANSFPMDDLCVGTDNMALSLAIGNTQKLWSSDTRLQYLWQMTWQHMPVTNSTM
jgi:hypothetical protein